MKALPVILVVAALFGLWQALDLVFALGKVVGAIEQRQHPFIRFTPGAEYNLGLPEWGTQVNDPVRSRKRS